MTKQEPNPSKRRLPIGAEIQKGGGVHFRVWAPKPSSVAVRLSKNADLSEATDYPLAREDGGYWSGHVPEASAGMYYKFALDSGAFPDMASRFQPEGPHGPSQIVDPGTFAWTDSGWKGVAAEGQVIYELHIGTLTADGTWAAAIEELPRLAELGVTLLEVMPVADFPGKFGWGYDGVNLFAPTRLYGSPDDFRRFVDRAHALGLGVILDVVYNHLGPDGNYIREYTPHYFSEKHANEWGESLNFDDEYAGPVREFFVENAGYWIDEYHLDGLRLDATHAIVDASKQHVLEELASRVREAAGGRGTFIVAENEVQEIAHVRSREEGGYGMDGMWNDDFHHAALVALTGRSEAYYSDYLGSPQEFVSAVKWGFLFQGQRYKWQGKRRGTASLDASPACFVNYLQNHDQVANSLLGRRIHSIASPGKMRALTALLLLGPNTPMLFQGQEYGAETPFLYFADHQPELAAAVAKGRAEFLSQFPSIGTDGTARLVPDPHEAATFTDCKLDPAERERNAETLELHKDLLALRKNDGVAGKSGRRDGAVLGAAAFVIRFFGGDAGDRLLLVNLGPDLHLDRAPEPLLAPPAGTLWEMAWSSEDPKYGGNGTPPIESDENWKLPAESAVLMIPKPIQT